MSEGRSHLDLQASHIANTKPRVYIYRTDYRLGNNYSPKYSSYGHHEPEVNAGQELEVEHGGDLSKDDHEGQKENTGIDIVVEGERPDVALNCWENLLCVD